MIKERITSWLVGALILLAALRLLEATGHLPAGATRELVGQLRELLAVLSALVARSGW